MEENMYIKKLEDEILYKPKDYENINNKLVEIKKIKFSTLEFIIFHEPLPAKRTRTVFKTKRFYVPDAMNNKKTIQKIFKEQLPKDFELIKGEIILDIKCYFPLIKNFSKIDKFLAEKGIIRPITKPDVDNLEKTYMDSCNKFLWWDDSQIIDARTRKYYSIEPRVEVKVKYRNKLLSAIFNSYFKNKQKNLGKKKLKKKGNNNNGK